MIPRFEQALRKRRQEGNLRRLGHPLSQTIDFSSNDSLGLARSESMARLIEEERDQQGGRGGHGSTGSRLLTGNTSYTEALEEELAIFHGYEAALLFSCGYMANMGLLTAIAQDEDTFFFDTSIHASTHAGIRLSRAQAFPFRHQDVEHLEKRLSTCKRRGHIFVCVESIYSTDGSRTSLREISCLCAHYGAHLIVDEAHATGVWGAEGKGIVEEDGLLSHVFAQVVTFGKALGVYGAIVLGSKLLKDYLLNFSPTCIYTTALPPYALAAIRSSYRHFPQMEAERVQIKERIRQFQAAFPEASPTHIQSIPMKGNSEARAFAHHLAKRGMDVRPLWSPTVPRGKEGLRVCLHAFNTEEEVHHLIENIHEYTQGTSKIGFGQRESSRDSTIVSRLILEI